MKIQADAVENILRGSIMKDELSMTVSPVCAKDGKKYAYVSFTDGERIAEGIIPDCKIMSNKGFSREELEQLEAYMKSELPKLKRMAAEIRVLDAFMK